MWGWSWERVSHLFSAERHDVCAKSAGNTRWPEKGDIGADVEWCSPQCKKRFSAADSRPKRSPARSCGVYWSIVLKKRSIATERPLPPNTNAQLPASNGVRHTRSINENEG